VARKIAKVARNPELYHRVTALYAGSLNPDPPSHFPPPPPSTTPKLSSPLKHEVDIDVNLIEHISLFNPIPVQDAMPAATPDTGCPWALYLLRSPFNHPCKPSAMWYNFGDVIVFSATKNLAEGDELTIPYTSGKNYRFRYRDLAPHMSVCDYPEYEADRTSGYLEPGRNPGWPIENLRKLVRDTERMYSATKGAYRLRGWVPVFGCRPWCNLIAGRAWWMAAVCG